MNAACRTTRHFPSPREGVLAVGLIVLLCGWTALAAQKRVRFDHVASISVHGSDRISLEDIDPAGRALILDRDEHEANPELLLWDSAKKAFVQRITPAWGQMAWPRWVPGVDRDPRSVKIIDGQGNTLGAFGYYLTFFGAQKTLRMILCAPDVEDPNSPYTGDRAQQTLPWSYVHGVVIERYNYSGLVAVASNFGNWPRLFLLRPARMAPYARWQMERFVKALAWSPDGKTLAVLYSNVFDNRLQFVAPMHRGQPWPTLPDVALVDVESGKTRLKFFSGDMETSIVFSPDGNFIYCAGYGGATMMRRWMVREFSASTGKLVREFKARGMKLKGGLVVSPDGKFLVADANSTRWSLGVIENDVYGYDRRFRFVILDTATCNVAFEHQERTHNSLLRSPPKFAFSPDGKYLYVDPRLHESGSSEIQVYSVGENH